MTFQQTSERIKLSGPACEPGTLSALIPIKEVTVSKPRIAINGFGRIGRTVVRIAKMSGQFDVVAVNDLADPDQLLYAFKYDSIHGTYPGEVGLYDNVMVIDGDAFKVLSEEDPEALPWKELHVDYVIESTGQFRHLKDLHHHLKSGAQRVLVTVPTKDDLESTVVIGVNDHVVTKDSLVISNASCTTNCAAPVAKVLHENFGIEHGLLTTIHAYTSDQRLIDSPHSGDLRRSRNAATNIIPTTTGAAKAIGRVLPELDGKLDGLAMRVPIPDGSLVDLTVELSRDTDKDEVNAAMKDSAQSDLVGILEYSEEALVSCDIVGNAHSSIFDASLTQVIDHRLVKVISWYDNEWGYSSRVGDLISRLALMDGISD
jgi:glyceraldehyde 3-phosphate dehydrogenase